MEDEHSQLRSSGMSGIPDLEASSHNEKQSFSSNLTVNIYKYNQ